MASPLTELLTSRIDRRVDYISHQLDPASHEISIPYLSEDEFIQNQSRGFAMAQSRGVWVGMPQDIARRRAAAAADDDDSSSDDDSPDDELSDDELSAFWVSVRSTKRDCLRSFDLASFMRELAPCLHWRHPAP